jgi:hypothetical protein
MMMLLAYWSRTFREEIYLGKKEATAPGYELVVVREANRKGIRRNGGIRRCAFGGGEHCREEGTNLQRRKVLLYQAERFHDLTVSEIVRRFLQ